MTENIVILGAGWEGSAVAAYLSHALNGTAIRLRLVKLTDESDELHETVSLLPQTQVFHEVLELRETDILQATDGAFNLGFRFQHWSEGARDFLQTYDSYGVDVGGVSFHHYYAKLKNRLNLPPFDSFSVSAIAGKTQRFCHPSADPQSALSTLSYGLNLDKNAYAEILKGSAARNGVQFVQGHFVGAQLDHSGNVEAVALDSGTISGDLFIDCSGEKALLLGNAMGVERRDWSPFFGRKRCLSFRQPHGRGLAAATSLSAHSNFWQKTLCLKTHSVITRVFEAETAEESAVAPPPGTDYRVTTLTTGHRETLWNKNVIAFGNAAVAFEPLPMADMDLLYHSLNAFVPLLPTDKNCGLNAAHYNRTAIRLVERLRDYHQLHYLLASPPSRARFWQDARQREAPTELSQQVQLFEHCGKFHTRDEEPVPVAMWASLLMGLGALPENHDPLTDKMDEARLVESLKRMHYIIQRTAEAMPAHENYLARYINQY